MELVNIHRPNVVIVKLTSQKSSLIRLHSINAISPAPYMNMAEPRMISKKCAVLSMILFTNVKAYMLNPLTIVNDLYGLLWT